MSIEFADQEIEEFISNLETHTEAFKDDPEPVFVHDCQALIGSFCEECGHDTIPSPAQSQADIEESDIKTSELYRALTSEFYRAFISEDFLKWDSPENE